MAMIGRGSAIAAMGRRRREVHGLFAFAAWLGVHAPADDWRPRPACEAVVDWVWVNVSRTRGPQVLDRAGRGGNRLERRPPRPSRPPPQPRGSPWT